LKTKKVQSGEIVFFLFWLLKLDFRTKNQTEYNQ